MKVLITGGTGFVGSHTVAATVQAGHDVRLLVRDVGRVANAPALTGLDASLADVVLGDATDCETVRRSLSGCDAVIHAANVYSFDPRHVETMRRVNEASTRIVLGESVARGLDPIVHVSTFAVLLPSTAVLTSASPVGQPKPIYVQTKAQADRVARDFQQQGAPVVITYPGAVWGPDDPYDGESTILLTNALKGRLRLLNEGNLPIVDVRDVGSALAAPLQPGLGPRSYLITGHVLSLRRALKRMGELAGRNLGTLAVPSTVALATGRASDWARARFGLDVGVNYSGAWILANMTSKADPSAAQAELGVEFRPFDETVRDTVRWLHASGHVSAKQAGLLAAG